MSKFRSSKGKNAPIQFLGTFLIILFVRVECFTTPPPGHNVESGGVRPQSHLQDSRPVLVSKDDLIEGITDDRHGNRLTNGNSSWQEPGRDARTIPLYLKGSGSEEDERVKTRDKRATTDAEFRKYGIMVSDAAIYLQHHKWFDYDHRFETRDPNHKKKAKAKVAAFVRRFPTPPLRKLKPQVEKHCEKGFRECVKQIAHYCVNSHIYTFMVNDVRKGATTYQAAPFRFLEHAKINHLYNYQPFRSWLALFQFRATAMYYMCWYTLAKHKLLRRFPGPCNYWWGKDYRATNKEDFGCALYSFCPDTCCSDVPSGTKYFTNAHQCKRSKKNPCYGISDGACAFDFKQNQDFKALTRNRLNITCKCDLQRRGFKWSTQYNLCVDEDECYEGSHNCSGHKVCRNTLGSYECACARGYEMTKDGKNECFRKNDMDWSEVNETETTIQTQLNKWQKAERIIDKVHAFFLSKLGIGSSTQVLSTNFLTLIAFLWASYQMQI